MLKRKQKKNYFTHINCILLTKINNLMKTNELCIYCFKAKQSYPAIVEKVFQNKVLFKIGLTADMKEFRYATYYVTGGNVNLFQIFTHKQFTTVTINKIFRNETLTVIPNELPVDYFIAKHPLGSTVFGKIHAITGSTVVVMLAPNVFCVTKRCKHAKTGMSVKCKINNYRASQKALSVIVIAA